MTLKIGIIGSEGARGIQLRTHFEAQGASVVSVANTDREVTILLNSDIDAVIISSPDYLHESHACAALEAGKHVYLEKPMAITPAGCDRIIAAAETSGRILYVGHNLRHFTVIQKLKELIDAGSIGQVRAVFCQHSVSYGYWAYFKEDRWHKKRKNIGSLLIHKGSHDLDVIHWLAGSTTQSVNAMGKLMAFQDAPDHPDVEDVSLVHMELHNGVLATYTQCHFAHQACREYTVIGTSGTLRNRGDDPAHATVELYRNTKGHSFAPESVYTFAPEEGFHGNADERIVREFIDCVTNSGSPTISIQEAAAAVKTAYAATHSLRHDGQRIVVS